MSIGVVAPLAAWLLLFALLCLNGFCIRRAFLISSVAWGTAVTLFTELLSILSMLNYAALLIYWLFFLIPLVFLFIRKRRSGSKLQIPTCLFENKAAILAICFILFCTYCIAILAPPNNGDSMTYHMSRVMHWIQNGSVRHYPTNVLRQLDMSPWAEFAILHLQLLSRGELLANLVQWFSLLGCIVGVSLIARHFSASPAGQALSGLVAATIPMAILQASSTQNDMVVSFWLVCFVYFGLCSLENRSWSVTVLMACSLGLALLTKGTAGIFALPFIVFFFVRYTRRSWRHAFVTSLLAGIIVLSFNFGDAWRDYALFRNPLHSGELPFANSVISGGVITSNLLRNVALHLLTPSRQINSHLDDGLRTLHALFGIPYHDPASTWMEDSFEGLRLLPSEDNSGNPLHLVLYLAVLLPLLTTREQNERRWFAACILAGFVLFCALLRWQTCHSRLQLPLFILFAPVAGIMLSEIRQTRIAGSVATLLTIATLPWIFCNISRPIYRVPLLARHASIIKDSRRQLYFNTNVESAGPYLAVIDTINRRGSRNVGLESGGNPCEYPIWMLTRTKGLDGPRIEHVKVQNASRSLNMTPFKPDIVVVMDDDGNARIQEP
jgi:hypothetical protein